VLAKDYNSFEEFDTAPKSPREIRHLRMIALWRSTQRAEVALHSLPPRGWVMGEVVNFYQQNEVGEVVLTVDEPKPLRYTIRPLGGGRRFVSNVRAVQATL